MPYDAEDSTVAAALRDVDGGWVQGSLVFVASPLARDDRTVPCCRKNECVCRNPNRKQGDLLWYGLVRVLKVYCGGIDRNTSIELTNCVTDRRECPPPAKRFYGTRRYGIGRDVGWARKC